MNTRECSKRHENKTWKDANKFSVLYQCQYPSCNIVTVVLQNVTIGEAGKSAVDLYYFLQLCANLQLLQ